MEIHHSSSHSNASNKYSSSASVALPATRLGLGFLWWFSKVPNFIGSKDPKYIWGNGWLNTWDVWGIWDTWIFMGYMTNWMRLVVLVVILMGCMINNGGCPKITGKMINYQPSNLRQEGTLFSAKSCWLFGRNWWKYPRKHRPNAMFISFAERGQLSDLHQSGFASKWISQSQST